MEYVYAIHLHFYKEILVFSVISIVKIAMVVQNRTVLLVLKIFIEVFNKINANV